MKLFGFSISLSLILIAVSISFAGNYNEGILYQLEELERIEQSQNRGSALERLHPANRVGSDEDNSLHRLHPAYPKKPDDGIDKQRFPESEPSAAPRGNYPTLEGYESPEKKPRLCRHGYVWSQEEKKCKKIDN